MLRKAYVVVSPVSTLTVDGAFYKKKTINFMKSSFSNLNGTIIPKSKKHYINLLLKEKFNFQERKKIIAEKYYLYYLTGGVKNRYLTGNINDGFKFNKNNRIILTNFEKLLYFSSKILEKYFFNYLVNYFFSKFVSVSKKSKYKV